MMTSFLDNIPAICNAAVSSRPKKILDVGAGFGKFGLLLREALLSIIADQGVLFPVPDFKIDACENSDYFLNQRAFYNIYDEVYCQDVTTISPDVLNTYDLLLLIDVIEHWTKEEYLLFMEKIKPGTKVLISTPREVVFYELPYYGIAKHKTQFSDSDFSNGQNFSTKDSYIYLI